MVNAYFFDGFSYFDDKLNWVNFLENSKEIYCAKDQIYNPIYLKDAAKVVYNISKNKTKNI